MLKSPFGIYLLPMKAVLRMPDVNLNGVAIGSLTNSQPSYSSVCVMRIERPLSQRQGLFLHFPVIPVQHSGRRP